MDRNYCSRRFLVSNFGEHTIDDCFTELKKLLPVVSHVYKRNYKIYFEIDYKKTVTQIKCFLPYLPLVEIVQFNNLLIVEGDSEESGTPLTNLPCPPPLSDRHLPEEYFDYVRFYKTVPSGLGDKYFTKKKKIKINEAVTQANDLNKKDNYSVILRPWQKQALQILQEQKDGDVLWIFDQDGRTAGKSEFFLYLRFKKGYQYLLGDGPREVAGMMNSYAEGYCVDMVRRAEKNSSKFGSLSEQIGNGYVNTDKYYSTQCSIQSTKQIFAANCMPNLAVLSLDRWHVFHTKLGLINLRCDPVGDNYYLCSIVQGSMFNANTNQEAKICVIPKLNDSDLYLQYMERHSIGCERYTFLYRNHLAFPKITGRHGRMVQCFVRSNQFNKLIRYINENGLLENSIAVNTNFINAGDGCSTDETENETDYSEHDTPNRRYNRENFQAILPIDNTISTVSIYPGTSQLVSRHSEHVDHVYASDSSGSVGAPYTEGLIEKWRRGGRSPENDVD